MMRGIAFSCALAASLFSTALVRAADAPAPPGAAPAATPTPEQIDEARRLFKVGVALLGDPDGAKYEEARAQFQRSYDLSGNWKVLSNLGVCQLKLERDGEAIRSYEAYLVGAGSNIDAEERAQVERDLGVLKAQVVTVRLSLPSAGATVTDERIDNHGNKVVNDYAAAGTTLELGLHPGQHTLTARLPGGVAKWDGTLSPGGTAEHTFELAPQAAPAPAAPEAVGTSVPAAPDQGAAAGEGSRPVPTSVWIGTGVTGALAIGAVVTGVGYLGKRSDYDKVNDPSHSEAEKSAARDSAASMGLVNTVLSAGALVGAGVTAYLFFSRPTESPPSERTGTVVAPWVTVGGGGLAVGGVL